MPERVTWLWPGRIPVGKIVTLDGDHGLGKSTLALTFAAVITTGGTWPDGTRCEHTGDVILLSAEDGVADTIRPRADAAGADVTRIHAVQGVLFPDSEGSCTLMPPTLADVDLLEKVIKRTGARLLIVDVLMAYLPTKTDSHKDQDIRRVLARLAALAERTGCTILLLRHLNKSAGGDPLYRGGGSIGIVGAARAGMLVARDPDDDGVRVLAPTKSNLGPAPDALTYRLINVEPHAVARVEWIGISRHDARALLADSSGEDADAATEAEAWLTDHLTQQGAAPSKDTKTEAYKKAGITERTLQRAAKTIGVVVESKGFPRVTWWSLPSRADTSQDTPASHNLGAIGATRSDLRKQSGATGQISQSRQGCESGPTVTHVLDQTRTRCPVGGQEHDDSRGRTGSASRESPLDGGRPTA